MSVAQRRPWLRDGVLWDSQLITAGVALIARLTW